VAENRGTPEQTVSVRQVESVVDGCPVWLQVVLIAAVTLLCPFLVALMLALILRRSGMQLRVEVINSGTAGPIIARLETPAPAATAGPAQASPAPVTGAAPAQESRLIENAPDLAERFDLGPSYEEEKQARDQAQRQKEMAVLQELFEQNQRLYEQIEQLPDEDEGAGEALTSEDDDQGHKG
jgi:hypothetical protein